LRYNHVRGIKHAVKAFGFSMAGLRAAWQYEEAFRIEMLLFIILAPLGFWLGDTPLERVVLVGCLMVVLITELLNSAVETTVDRVSEEQHKLSGRAKDIGSAAVFIALMNVVLVWGLILVPKYI
jgi:diacylglycerol kinase (ATP)